jgi:hypothetical protein
MAIRQEVLNVLLAQLLQKRGLLAAPEQIQNFRQQSRQMPDVLVDFQSLRLPKLDPDPGYEPKGEPIVIAVDSEGVKVTNRGEWMRRKRQGYVKIHVAVDVRAKQAVSLEVSDERTHDGEKLEPLVRQAHKKAVVAKALGDGAYDSWERMAQELRLKVWVYNLLLGLTVGLSGTGPRA